MTDPDSVPKLHWLEDGKAFEAQWRSHSDSPPPVRVVVADGKMTADAAYDHACQGTALLWRGDFQEARQMLTALGNRADRRKRRSRTSAAPSATASPAGTSTPHSAEAFHLLRQARSQRARTLNSLLIPLNDDYAIPLRRAPDIRQACVEAFGPAQTASVTSLRALLGVIGAHEWRTKGIEIAEAGGRIYPYFGVFAPIRREYIDLVSTAPLPSVSAASSVAFDIGTGTGVLAAVLARRGIERVVATDLDPRAIECASENVRQLGLVGRIDVVQADLFPEGRAALVVCNPPWIPARPSSPMENGIYDSDSRMLRGFLAKLPEHLTPGGEGWLILSDLAELLSLRTRAQLLGEFEAAGLRVAGRIDIPPRHPRASDKTDPLHVARAAEITSLWRLAVA
ncbi:MAG: class I SAM-dependent methyltransferase [Steroidobacteraceae bacterium]|nr:class I SAM-dependent methyltransferase [Steroidobacteraceae bacterium]